MCSNAKNTTDASMTSKKNDKASIITLALGLVFGSVLIILILNGGMCERYERRMHRQQMMQQYLDSSRHR